MMVAQLTITIHFMLYGAFALLVFFFFTINFVAVCMTLAFRPMASSGREIGPPGGEQAPAPCHISSRRP